MDFKEYQKLAHTTSKCPLIGKDFVYPILGIAGEAGEVANKVKKIFRDDNGVLTEARKQEITKELGDILWYIAESCTAMNLSLDEVALTNLARLKKRLEENKINGDGDNR